MKAYSRITQHHSWILLSLIIIFYFVSAIEARNKLDSKAFNQNLSLTNAIPNFFFANHNVGRITLAVSNEGIFGFAFSEARDSFTGERVPRSCEFPKGSHLEHLYALSLWFGTIVKGDTLVSTGFDGWGPGGDNLLPDPAPGGEMIYRSILNPDIPEYEGAVSEQDYIAVYTDTSLWIGNPNLTGFEPHRPINIKITQRSYAWSYPYTEDFVIVDLSIENIGDKMLNQFYIGLYADCDVGLGREYGADASDDVCGFLKQFPSFLGCDLREDVNIAWIADNDGDPYEGEFIDYIVYIPIPNPPGVMEYKSAPHVTGTRILQPPSPYMDLSFNWWISSPIPLHDFGPQQKCNYRDFGDGALGTPVGDANKHRIMSNGEFDYDQAYTAVVRPDDETWMYPNQAFAGDYADGYDTRYLLSYGPFSISPGATLPLTFAYVAGENFHTDPTNINNLPDDPDRYYSNLDFSDLAENSTWATWVYDNPGVDTDGDGFYGKYHICVHDSTETDTGWIPREVETIYYAGDGIPDFRAAIPPPAPVFRVEPMEGALRIRFNGTRTENTPDLFTRIVDFEGYHIWLGRDNRETSLSLIAQYDIENYDKYTWNANLLPIANYELKDNPYSLEELRCLYGSGYHPCDDEGFDPIDYTRGNPYIMPGYPESLFIFVPHIYNNYQFGITTPIYKVYPDEPPPSSNAHPDSLTPDRYTEEGFLKYYEYEFIVDNLLATVPYWVNVTTFDFGSPASGVHPLETSKLSGLTMAYPLIKSDQMSVDKLDAYIYPNPYRLNGGYRASGYEGRMHETLPNDKVRAIHFNNLPHKCTIRIYSLDGDLIRQLKHDCAPDDPNRFHHHWNLVNRNRQAVVSGLYYWTIEDDSGRVQIGKLAIIM